MRIEEITREYGGGWEETSREELDPDGIKAIEITEKDFRQDDGSTRTRVSMCFTMDNGRQRFIPLSRDSELEVGDHVDPETVEVITLERDGEEIYRCDGELLPEKPKTKKKK